MSNDRKYVGWPVRALQSPIEIRDIQGHNQEDDRRVYERLNRLSVPDALGGTLTELLSVSSYFASTLRRVGTKDAESVAKFTEKAVAEAMVATCAILTELKK